MQSTSFRLISGAVTILLLGSLALVVRLALLSNATTPATFARARAPATTKPKTSTPLATKIPTLAAAGNFIDSTVSELDNVQLVAAGGFSFRPLVGYALEWQAGSVNMLAKNDAANGASPAADAFLLSGGRPEQFAPQSAQTSADIFNQYVNYYAKRDNFRIGVRHPITVDGADGFAVDLTSIDTAKHFAGRIVMAQPRTDQVFVMVGVAPAGQWTAQTSARFEAVLASVKLFAVNAPVKVAGTVTFTRTLPTNLEITPQPGNILTPTAQLALAHAPPSTGIEPAPTVARLPTSLGAASGKSHWQTYSNANKINDLAVYKSTLWAATQGGVVAWNIQNDTFVKFTTLDGLTANRATAVAICPLPGLGIVFGSEQGLQIFDPQSGRWKSLNSSNSSMSFDDVTVVICSVGNNFLLVGYKQHGFDILDTRTGTWTYMNQGRGLQNDFVDAVAVVGNRDAIWVSSGFGISVLTPQGATFVNHANSPLETNQITAMTVDKTDTVWLGARDSVYKVSGGNWTVYSQLSVLASRFPTGDMNGLAVADDGSVWIGSSKGEICHFDPVKVQCLDFFASADDPTKSMVRGKLTRLTLDQAGNVYYATDGGGLSRYDGTVWHPLTILDEILAGNEVHAIAQAKDNSIWVATESGLQQLNHETGATLQLFTAENSGLTVTQTGVLQTDAAGGLWFGALNASYYNGANWTVYTAADGLADGVVQNMAVDNQQRIWFGTKAGLSVWNGNTFFSLNKTTGLPSDDVTALLADGDKMWIGTNGGGLLRFEKNQLQVLSIDRLGLPTNIITALARDKDNSLLVGTNRGLARLRNGVATLVAEIAGFPITAIAPTPDGKLWVGTQGNGLLYFDGQTWTQPPGGGKPPANQITALLVDQQGKVWVGGKSGGLIRYNP